MRSEAIIGCFGCSAIANEKIVEVVAVAVVGSGGWPLLLGYAAAPARPPTTTRCCRREFQGDFFLVLFTISAVATKRC